MPIAGGQYAIATNSGIIIIRAIVRLLGKLKILADGLESSVGFEGGIDWLMQSSINFADGGHTISIIT